MMSFDFNDLEIGSLTTPRPVSAPPKVPPEFPKNGGENPFSIRVPKHPAKYGMLIATWAWVMAWGLSFLWALYVAFTTQPLVIGGVKIAYSPISLILQNTIYYGFVCSIFYGIAMTVLFVWYFCTRQD